MEWPPSVSAAGLAALEAEGQDRLDDRLHEPAGVDQALKPDDRAGLLLTALAGAALTYSLMQSLVIPALPAIERSLDASPVATSWTVTGFLLSSSVATPIAGRLGDMFGKRRVLVVVLAIVSAGTLLCTVPSMTALIAGRVVQGVGGGVMPLAYAIVRDELPQARIARGIAVLASLIGVGAGLGVIAAGLVIEHLSYTWLFWLQLPAFAAVGLGVTRYVPDSELTVSRRIDWTGAILASAGLLALMLTVTQASRWGLVSVRTACGLALAIALLALWGRSALRQDEPLLDLRLMRRRPVWTTNVVAFLVGVGQFAGFILLPQYVQEPVRTGYGLGASPLAAGFFLLPLTVTTALGGISVGRLERRFGAKLPLIAGNVLTAVGFGLLTVARGGRADLYCASGLLGAGSGLALATLSTLIVANVAQHETGAAAGVNNVARTLGGAVGGQLAAAFLATSLSASVVGAPTAGGYTAAFAVGLVAMIAATVVGPILPGRLEDPTGTGSSPLGVTVGLAYRR